MHLRNFAEVVKAWHVHGPTQWTALVETASMWLDYQGLRTEGISGIQSPVLVPAGNRHDQGFASSCRLALPVPALRRARDLPKRQLGPITPARAQIHAAMIRDFAQRHSQGR